MKKSTYFDYAATTPVDDDVLASMLPYFQIEFGNPSSIHSVGQAAEAALENARETCGSLLNTKPENIIFTSGGTESDNLALRGIALHRRKEYGVDEIVISPVEHHAVSKTAEQLCEEFGFKIKYLDIDSFGMVSPDDLKKVINSKTAIVSVIYANNEVGTVNPIPELGKICQDYGVPFHSDAVQAAAHLPMSLVDDNVSLLSVGAHKMYGPKGIGLLAVNTAGPMLPILTGGGQERHLRAGTQNVPLIVGLAKALENSQKNNTHVESYAQMQHHLITEVLRQVPDSRLTGHPTSRLPNHASFVFDGVDGNRLLMLLDARGFACSSGSACKVGSPLPSEVLLAMNFSPEIALSSLRISLGKSNTFEQIDQFVQILVDCIGKLRQ